MTEVFSIVEVMQAEIDDMLFLKILAVLLILMQFLLLNLYLRVHPRVAVLMATLGDAFDDMVHFLILFGIIFIILGFSVFWTLGTAVIPFRSFGHASMRQFEMIIGEYPWDSLEGLPAGDQMFLVIYMILYSVMAFFILINFLLAIVVEAFVQVKNRLEEQVTENSSFYDTFDMVMTWYFFFRWRLPNRYKLIEALQKLDSDDPDRKSFERCAKVNNGLGEFHGAIDVEDLLNLQVHPKFTKQTAALFLRFYYAKVEDLLMSHIEHDQQKLVLLDVGEKMETRRQHLVAIQKEKNRGTDPLTAVDRKAETSEVQSLELTVMLRDQEIGRLQAQLEQRYKELCKAQQKVWQLKQRASSLGLDGY